MRRTNDSDQLQKPVFIVGMNGSGTTMMLDHLGRHPDLFGFTVETYILPHYLLNSAKYGALTVDENFLRLWNDMRAEYAFRRRNKGAAMSLPADWSATQRSVGGVFDRIMLEFAEREGKHRWCEKTPMYVLHIERLAAAFPGSVFIHMLRDGRDCAASDHRRWGRHPEGTITRWKYLASEGRRQGNLVGDRYCEVRYEDVTGNPEPEMRRICSFLDIDFNESVLTTEKSPRNQGPDSKSIVDNRNKNTGYFTSNRLRSLNEIAGRQLSLLGYPTDNPEGNLNPGRIKHFWWFLYDARAVLFRQLRNKLTVQKRMTWSLYLARLKSTLRKSKTSTTGVTPGSGDDE
jgi:hypothetical protein